MPRRARKQSSSKPHTIFQSRTSRSTHHGTVGGWGRTRQRLVRCLVRCYRVATARIVWGKGRWRDWRSVIDQSTDHTTENHPSYKSLKNANCPIFAFPRQWAVILDGVSMKLRKACFLKASETGKRGYRSQRNTTRAAPVALEAALTEGISWHSSGVR